MTMTYKPKANSIPSRVIAWLCENPDEELTADDIVAKFGSQTRHIHGQLAAAITGGALVRATNDELDIVYRATKGAKTAITLNPSLISTDFREVDPKSLEVCNDPMPEHRATPGEKYNELFSSLKPGQCIKCRGDQAPHVAGAMRKWIKKYGFSYSVRMTKAYPSDGQGRVWMLLDESARVTELKRAA